MNIARVINLRPRSFVIRTAFTLIELLVVITIIAILAAMLLPVIFKVQERAKIARATAEIANLVNAIHQYEATYHRFPSATTNAIPGVEDLTFGTEFLTSSGVTDLPDFYKSYHPNNDVIMAILLDIESYQNGQPTVNKDHVKNPQRTAFLNVKMVNDTVSPGVGTDLVYRDPWGNPYIITIDLNNDEKCREVFYCKPAVSGSPADIHKSVNGLIEITINGSAVFEANDKVVVWSAGPDRKIEANKKANQGANKDNITSWQH